MKNDYNPRNARHAVAAIVCTLLCSTVLILGTVAPAQAGPTHQIAAHA